MDDGQKSGFSATRALLVGVALVVFISVAGPYNMILIRGSCMTIDFPTPAAIFLLFVLAAMVNVLLRKAWPRAALPREELLIVFLMMTVACSICTMGLTLYLIPILPAAFGFASRENRWAQLIHPYVEKWMVPQGDRVIECFYRGLPDGEPIPWLAWARPLIPWFAFLFALYVVSIALVSLLRKQWVENESLVFPLTQAPMAMAEQEKGRLLGPFFRNPLMWMGFAIPFVIGCLNALHNYFDFVPTVTTVWSLPCFRRTMSIVLRLSYPMIGFSYLVSLDVSLSLWLLYLVSTVIQGYMNIIGFRRDVGLDIYAIADGGTVFSYVQAGALFIFVGHLFWVARGRIREVARNAVHPPADGEPGEFMSSRAVAVCLIGGFLFMTSWLTFTGIPWWASAGFVLIALGTFIGISRAICEAGLAETRAPMISPTVIHSAVGSNALGPAGIVGLLAYGQVWMSDVRTFVMAAAANGMKLAEVLRRRRVFFWALVLAVAVALPVSAAATLWLAYRHGAMQANQWFFANGPKWTIGYAAHAIQNPTGPDFGGWCLGGLGGLLMGGLLLVRRTFPWWPISPIGLPFCQNMLTRQVWFSIFLAWLVKAVVLRYGGPRVYRATRPFFLGLILGQFAVAGLWLIIDLFTGKTGNSVFWV